MGKVFVPIIVLIVLASGGYYLTDKYLVGSINSLTIDSVKKTGGWLLYRDGAEVKLVGQNLRSAEIRYLPTGTEMGEEYRFGKILGQMKLENSDNSEQVWLLTLPADLLTSSFYALGQDRLGRTIKSEDLGNVAYQEW